MSAQRCGDETDGDSMLVGESRSRIYCSEWRCQDQRNL